MRLKKLTMINGSEIQYYRYMYSIALIYMNLNKTPCTYQKKNIALRIKWENHCDDASKTASFTIISSGS